MTCQGCTEGQHFLCGMQTWCECDCDGSTDYGAYEIDPDLGFIYVESDDD